MSMNSGLKMELTLLRVSLFEAFYDMCCHTYKGESSLGLRNSLRMTRCVLLLGYRFWTLL